MLLERVLKCKIYVMKAHTIAIAESNLALSSLSSPWENGNLIAPQCTGFIT